MRLRIIRTMSYAILIEHEIRKKGREMRGFRSGGASWAIQAQKAAKVTLSSDGSVPASPDDTIQKATKRSRTRNGRPHTGADCRSKRAAEQSNAAAWSSEPADDLLPPLSKNRLQ